jgi:hypothetical protein
MSDKTIASEKDIEVIAE